LYNRGKSISYCRMSVVVDDDDDDDDDDDGSVVDGNVMNG
jgi:hypothetical protein